MCHGELVRIKPPAQGLSAFYLAIACGGVFGGLFVGLIAPAIFNSFLDLDLGIVAFCILMLWLAIRKPTQFLARTRWAWTLLCLWCGALLLVLVEDISFKYNGNIAMKRNFYGVLSVEENGEGQDHYLALSHGAVYHGMQYSDETRSRQAVSYYGEDSGVAQSFRYLKKHRQSLRIGVVGLGVGTLAAYGRAADEIRIYEIDPDVYALAQSHFTYLRDCLSKLEVVLGDGRLSLAQEAPREFDILVLDAFSGGSIPVHLLTREAFEVYLKHVKPNGAIVCNISNRYLDLAPVMQAHADQVGFHTAFVDSPGDEDRLVLDATWITISENRGLIRFLELQRYAKSPGEKRVTWTDEKASPLHIMR